MSLTLTSGSHIKQLCRIANDYNVTVTLTAKPNDPNTYLLINDKVYTTVQGENSINLDDKTSVDSWLFGDTEVDRILQKVAQLSDNDRKKFFNRYNDCYRTVEHIELELDYEDLPLRPSIQNIDMESY